MNILIIGGKGYCGSFLAKNLSEHKITVLDTKEGSDIQSNYINFENYSIDDFDTILWFAGKSSVEKAERDPVKTLEENSLSLGKLLKICKEKRKYLIYASSASVYSNDFNKPVLESKETDLIYPGINAYDKSKFITDYIAKGFFFDFLSLRLGTVCGFSDPIREDTLFNSMNISAIKSKPFGEGSIYMSNPEAYRSLLFLDDLLSLIEIAIQKKPKGILNAASLNIQIKDVAKAVKDYYGVKIIPVKGSKGYSFMMDLFRLKNLVSFPEVSLLNRCKEFEEKWKLHIA